MTNHALSRRGFLALGGGAGLSLALAACSAGGSGSKSSSGGTSTALVMGTQPTGWAAVESRLNARLKKDLGLTLAVQFVSPSNYIQQTLLKFTSNDSFDTALEAPWASLYQLEQDKSLVDLTHEIPKKAKLSAELPSRLLDANTTDGHLWGIPQVNSAARLQHFVIRQDLAEKYGFSSIDDYETLERFLYAVKQKGGAAVPYGANSSTASELAVPGPVGLFNEASWADPHTSIGSLPGSGLDFVFSRNAADSGSSQPKPFWEDESTLDTLRRIRKYYQDGIINADAVSTDAATVTSRWESGSYAATWGITDGTSSNVLPTMRKSIKGANLADIVPLKGGLTATKPNQSFQADNVVVVNANGGNTERAMAVQEWLSIGANHDLLEYGIEGTDWKALSGDRYTQLSEYTFPGYALCWRASLERRSSYMTESEATVFDWAQDYGNFTTDPFASFQGDSTPVKQAAAQMSNVVTQYANPLFYGLVDVDKQIDSLKKAAENAGLEKIQTELGKQADAYLKQQKKGHA